MRLDLKVMFFDATRDFLPHYRSFCVDVEPGMQMRKLYELIGKMDGEFDFDPNYPLCRIEGYVIPPSVKVEEVVERFGAELVLDGAFRYRCIDDFVMDESDFERGWKLIEPYATMEDRFFYRSLKDLHYASSTLEFDKEYIGDATLVVAYHMIRRGHPQKEAILEAISKDVRGLWSCEYENLVFGGRDFSKEIEELKSMATPPKPGMMERIASKFAKKRRAPQIDALEEVPVAFYRVSSQTRKIFEELGVPVVRYSRENRKAGYEILDTDPEIALKKGAALLLDAMDSGADLLVCDDGMGNYFRENFGRFERASGREIYLEILTETEAKALRESHESGV